MLATFPLRFQICDFPNDLHVRHVFTQFANGVYHGTVNIFKGKSVQQIPHGKHLKFVTESLRTIGPYALQKLYVLV